MRSALGRDYRLAQFVEDIRRGLPEPKFEPPPSCTVCAKYKTGSGRLVLLGPTGELLAEAPTEGTRYCEQYRLLRAALGDPKVRASQCPHFQATIGKDKEGQDARVE